MIHFQFHGKLTQADSDDVADTTRSRWFWFKFLASNWYGIALMFGIVWVTIEGLLGQMSPNWTAMGIIWLVIVGGFAWAAWSTQRESAKKLATFNEIMPETITLADDGVHLLGAKGAATLPWSSYKKYQRGKRVLLLYTSASHMHIVPLHDMDEAQQLAVERFVAAHIEQAQSITVG